MLAVVTPVYGSDRHMREIFDRLYQALSAERPDLWVIVFDDTSSWVTDYKAEFIIHIRSGDHRQATKKNIALDWLSERGVESVFFIDADQIPEKGLINEVRELLKENDVVEIPELFGKPSSYLQGSHYASRTIYHETIEGIPRAFRMEVIGGQRFNPRFHYVEDILFWKILLWKRKSLRRARTRKVLIHYERFSLTWFITKKLLAMRGFELLRIADRILGEADGASMSRRNRRRRIRSFLLTLRALNAYKYYALGILFLTTIKALLKAVYKLLY